MQLKSLEINGFKSFAEKTTFEFDVPISAIVGPNGSGKSNAVEAFRFVLGEQSMKSMRSKRGEDLLFNGSRSVSRANRARVAVTFDNSDRLLDIDYDEVKIERVVNRDASNEYILNGSEVRLKDITELLAKANIGPSGHHIISQGEADKILTLNARERKQMIEDALGLKVYHYKIEKAQKKLEKTEQNLKEVKSVRRELKPRLEYLEKQVKKLKKAENLTKDLTEKYKEYFKRESVYIKHKKETINQEMEEPKQRLEKLQKEKKEAKALLDESEEEKGKSKEEERLEALEKKLKEKRSEKDEISRKVGRVEGEITSEKRALKRAQKQQSQTSSIPYKKVKTLVNSLSTTISAALEGKEDAHNTLKEVKRRLQSLVKEYQGEEGQEDQAESIKETLNELKEKKRKLKKKVAKIENEEEEVLENYQALETSIKNQEEEKQKAEKRILEIQAEESEVQSRLNSLKSQKERVSELEQDLKEELGEAGSLVGREATEYEDVAITDENGQKLTAERIIQEKRSKQKKRRKEIEKMKAKLENIQLDASRDAIDEYEEVKERDEFLEGEIEDLRSSKQKLTNLIEELEETLEKKFKKGVEQVSEKFSHFFSVMFGGGEASIAVIKEDVRGHDEPQEGVEIRVSLPHKRIEGLEMLSGGERALTSIALLFAMTQINPPPFLVLDEMDAALDEANSRKYGDLLEDLAEESQLVLITHNRETMSRADRLYGVTMGNDGVSKLLSIEFEEAVKVAK